MQRLCLEKPETKTLKDKPDLLLNHLAGKGLKHESDYLNTLQTSGKHVVTIADELSNNDKIKATKQAMSSGAEIIFQACLAAGEFQGFADFLVKVDTPSLFGDYSYEPWDTKLAKKPKAYFIIQLCCYADLLQQTQGVLPENIAVVLGTNEEVSFRTADFWHYYLSQKESFLAQQLEFDSSEQPDPFQCKDVGEWSVYVDDMRSAQDHLSLTANITRLQIQKLNRAGINTCKQLVETKDLRVSKLPIQIAQRLQNQAKLQAQSIETGILAYEIIPVDTAAPKGLVNLPSDNTADLFFDLEGNPLEEGGLEYLWGCTHFAIGKSGKRQRLFWERWAHDHEQEKQAFMDFVDFAYKRWRNNPDMHIYHYGHYEVSVCKRLMGRYGVRETEIDEMLRAAVFVDLYKVIQHGMFLGASSYSIKKAEQLFRDVRDTDVASGSESVVVYAKWQEMPDGGTWHTSKVLSNIRDYNIDDCESTQELTDWLRNLQASNGIQYKSIVDTTKTNAAKEPDKIESEQNEEVDIDYEEALRAIASSESETDDYKAIATQLADMYDFFERQNKPMWWKFFERLEMTYEELFDDPDCLVDCESTGAVPYHSGKTTRSALVYEYRYNTHQEFRNRRFNKAQPLDPGAPALIIDKVDTQNCLVYIRAKKGYLLPDYLSLVVNDYIDPKKIKDSMQGVAKCFVEERSLSSAVKCFLLRSDPKLPENTLRYIDEAKSADRLELIIQAIAKLDNSFLSVQGPPGTGKTYTASHVIAALVSQGKSVAISSNSHKAINNLMIAVAKVCAAKGIQAPMYKRQDDDDEMFAKYSIEQLDRSDVKEGVTLEYGVYGATAWGIPSLNNIVDYLFIDEAGQVSVAYFVAMARSAKNVVVMGDQMQLPQPVQGTHPGDSGLSILDYQLKGLRTIPKNLGIFLNRSYRMHKNVNEFISEMVYDCRLVNDADCDNQEVLHARGEGDITLNSTGIVSLPIKHSGNKQTSIEEIELIQKLVAQLYNSEFVDKAGHKRQMTSSDILVVAPFNCQVNELMNTLGDDARVGTVDLFQGQEAPVVIVAMTSSNAVDSPRGMNFLLNINRLNVAISRAQALAIVVHSDGLLDGAPGSIEDMNRFNFFESITTFG
jgi:uncharacterized protein